MARKNKSITIIILLILSLFILISLSQFNKINQDYKNNKNTIQELTHLLNENKEEINKCNNVDQLLKEAYTTYEESIIQLEQDIINKKTDKKIAYLTIDDGPYELTYEFLKVLKQYNVKATFFTLMKPDRKEIYKKIIEDGHTIGNHTASHTLKAGGIYSSANQFVNDVHTLEHWLEKEFNIKTTLYRFPGGVATSGNLRQPIAQTLAKEGYKYVEWNVDVGDGSTEALLLRRPYDYFLDQIKDQDIALILMHDYSYKTLEDLPKIIEYLQNNNYIILPLSNKSIMVQ